MEAVTHSTHSAGMDMGSEIQKELDPLENARLQFEEAAQRLNGEYGSFWRALEGPYKGKVFHTK